MNDRIEAFLDQNSREISGFLKISGYIFGSLVVGLLAITAIGSVAATISVLFAAFS